MNPADDIQQHDEPPPPSQKKRRIQTAKACERCRLKKIRCDGTLGSDVKCSHCRTANAICVFSDTPKERPRGRKHASTTMEARLERLEALLGRLQPETDPSHYPDDALPHRDPSVPQQTSSPSDNFSQPPLPISQVLSHVSSDPKGKGKGNGDEDEDEDEEDLPPSTDAPHEFAHDSIFGKSSGVQLLQRVLNLKAEGTGMHYDVHQHLSNTPYKRPDFWETHPWESRPQQVTHTSYTFPDSDLLPVLVDNFFHVPGFIFPILHRPTFEKQLADGLHHTDDGFGNVVLLVCALGAMWLDGDPRVFVREPDGTNYPHSAGWPWFNQVQLVRNMALIDPSLRDLQICALAAVFMHASCPPQTCWTLVGVGLRVMQDLGAHRRQTYVDKSPVEAEHWKRAFWVLLTLDTWLSSFLGRPCALSIDSVDVELPVDCDDEYWMHTDPMHMFKQPPGIPSMKAFAIAWFKLHVIHAHALQTIYSTDKQRIIAQIGRPEWERRTVAELDAALNKWFDSIPDHLRWDPTCANDFHFFGAVSLLAGYYLVQMTIHRSFIRSSRKKSALSFQSLTLCVNAARACSHVLEVALLRQPGPTPSLLIPAFMSGIVLLLGMWTAKRTGLVFDIEKETQDVRNCVKFIRSGENRWPTARRLINLLRNLSAAGDLPATESPKPNATRKRARSSEPQESLLAPALASSSNAMSPPPSSGLHDSSTSRRASQPTLQSPLSTFGPSLATGDSVLRVDPKPTTSLAGTRVSTRAILVPLGGTSGLGRAADPAPPPSSSPVYGGANPSIGHAIAGVESTNALAGPSFNAQVPPVMEELPFGVSGAFQDMFGPMSGVSGMAPFETPNPSVGVPGGGIGGAVAVDGYGDIGGVGGGGQDADPLVNYFASLVPQDGQMDVDSGMMALWSTLPDSFQAEDWDTYVSNLVDIGTDGGLGVSTTDLDEQNVALDGVGGFGQ